jgi:hypothetical protein
LCGTRRKEMLKRRRQPVGFGSPYDAVKRQCPTLATGLIASLGKRSTRDHPTPRFVKKQHPTTDLGKRSRDVPEMVPGKRKKTKTADAGVKRKALTSFPIVTIKRPCVSEHAPMGPFEEDFWHGLRPMKCGVLLAMYS